MDITHGLGHGLGFLGQLFGGLFSGGGGFGDWWKSRQGETPAQPQPEIPTPATPAASQYSADYSNPITANLLGASPRMTTFGSMVARQPNL
jgi:hypothetical protein